jgi:hypothetical protein
MPKTTPESEYIKYMSSLQNKIRAEEVGLQSWKGAKRVQIAPIKMSVNDTLLAGDKLNKAQQQQNKMIEEYLDKQNKPIIRYDEFGNVIGEFKYHEIPPPELEDINLNLPAKIETSYDADGNLVETELVPARRIDIPVGNIEEVKARETTRFNNNMTTLNLEIRNQITEIETEEANLLNANDEIIQARQERKVFLDELQTIFDNRSEEIKQTEPKGREKAKKQLIANTKQQRKIFLADNDRVIRQLQAYTQFARLRIADFKRQLDELQKLKQLEQDQYTEINAEIDKVSTNNKKKIQAYQQTLQRMNTGAFGLNRNVDETDLEYAVRLEAIANEEFPTARVEEKANQLNKEELREKLSTLFRDRSMIENIVNTLDLQNNVYALNSQFTGFKTAFEKRYGEFNKTIKIQDILQEIDNYLEEI